MVVWADFEGMPRFSSHKPFQQEQPETSRLAVLRSGPLISTGDTDPQNSTEGGWISRESLGALSHLCYDFLKWSQFSIRSLRAKAIFEWEKLDETAVAPLTSQLRIIRGCDGPMVQILRTVRAACEEKRGD